MGVDPDGRAIVSAIWLFAVSITETLGANAFVTYANGSACTPKGTASSPPASTNTSLLCIDAFPCAVERWLKLSTPMNQRGQSAEAGSACATSECAQLNPEATAMTRRNSQQDRSCPRHVYRGLVSPSDAASRAHADEVLAFLEEEPDLLARAQVGDQGAVNVEMRRTCNCRQAFVSRYHHERESFVCTGKFGRANPVHRDRFRGRARHWRRAAGDHPKRDTQEPPEPHGVRL
jgi:hypothetical protein